MRRSLRLSDRDRQILRHTHRHGITTPEALQAQFFAGQSREAVKSTLKRLCGSQLLTGEPLDSCRVCYRLTPHGARIIAAGRIRARPLGLRARAERYAVLWFVCVDRPEQRALFNPREFPDQFDIGPHRLPRANFYLEDTAAGRAELGYLLIDYQSDPRRIVRRATQTVERFLQRGWFDQYIQAGAMRLTLLTTTKGRARDLRRKIVEFWQQILPREHQDALPLTAVAVPGLAELLTYRLSGSASKETE